MLFFLPSHLCLGSHISDHKQRERPQGQGKCLEVASQLLLMNSSVKSYSLGGLIVLQGAEDADLRS